MKRLLVLVSLLMCCAHKPPLTPEELEMNHWMYVRDCNNMCKGRGLLRIKGQTAYCTCVTT